MPDHAMLSVLARAFDRAGSRWRPWFDASAALPGFPVRTIRRYPDGTVQQHDGVKTNSIVTVSR